MHGTYKWLFLTDHHWRSVVSSQHKRISMVVVNSSFDFSHIMLTMEVSLLEPQGQNDAFTFLYDFWTWCLHTHARYAKRDEMRRVCLSNQITATSRFCAPGPDRVDGFAQYCTIMMNKTYLLDTTESCQNKSKQVFNSRGDELVDIKNFRYCLISIFSIVCYKLPSQSAPWFNCWYLIEYKLNDRVIRFMRVFCHFCHRFTRFK